jgi:hypothetical protein
MRPTSSREIVPSHRAELQHRAGPGHFIEDRRNIVVPPVDMLVDREIALVIALAGLGAEARDRVQNATTEAVERDRLQLSQDLPIALTEVGRQVPYLLSRLFDGSIVGRILKKNPCRALNRAAITS